LASVLAAAAAVHSAAVSTPITADYALTNAPPRYYGNLARL